jgi:hypothetical protein
MSLRNKNLIAEEIIKNNTETRMIRVLLIEEILSDDSKAYNIETIFYAGMGPDIIFTLEDASCVDLNEACKTWNRIIAGLSVLENSEVL